MPGADAQSVPGAEKFDPGFLDLVYAKAAAGGAGGAGGASGQSGAEPRHGVLVIVGPDPAGPESPAGAAKERVAAALSASHGAVNVVPAKLLSFVTADVPVSQIPLLGRYGDVLAIGDGEVELASPPDPFDAYRQSLLRPEPDYGFTQRIISALDLERNGVVYNGTGVAVAVIDSYPRPFPHAAVRDLLGDRASVTFCSPECGPEDSRLHGSKSDHGIMTASILAGSYGKLSGIAPGADVHLIIMESVAGVFHAMDFLLEGDVRVVNHSFQWPSDGLCYLPTYAVIMDEAASRGLVMVQSAGNQHANTAWELTAACAHNTVVAGGVQPALLRPDELVHYGSFSHDRMKPDLVALSSNVPAAFCIEVPSCGSIKVTGAGGGTSASAPQVSAAAAIVLQAAPEYGPLEARTILQLGADWPGPVPCTVSDLESPGGSCTYLEKNPTGTGKLNVTNAGFGTLNVSRSLDYALAGDMHVASGELGVGSARTYLLRPAPGHEGPQKAILSWFSRPTGVWDSIASWENPPDMNLRIFGMDGRLEYSSASDTSATEFAVFEAEPGRSYVAEVSAGIGGAVEGDRFVLASTMEVDPISERDPAWAAQVDEALERLRRGLGGPAAEGQVLELDAGPAVPGLSYTWFAAHPQAGATVSGGGPAASVAVPGYGVFWKVRLGLSVGDGSAVLVRYVDVPVEPEGSYVTAFYDGFESGLDRWSLSGPTNWEVIKTDSPLGQRYPTFVRLEEYDLQPVPNNHLYSEHFFPTEFPINPAARLPYCYKPPPPDDDPAFWEYYESPGTYHTSQCQMTSPKIDLSGYESASLSFWYKLGLLQKPGNKMFVEVYNGSSWNGVLEETGLVGPFHPVTNPITPDLVREHASWRNASIDLGREYLIPEFQIRALTNDGQLRVVADSFEVSGILRAAPSLAAHAEPRPGGAFVAVFSDSPARFLLGSASIGGAEAGIAALHAPPGGTHAAYLVESPAAGLLEFSISADGPGWAHDITEADLPGPVRVGVPPGPPSAASSAHAGAVMAAVRSSSPAAGFEVAELSVGGAPAPFSSVAADSWLAIVAEPMGGGPLVLEAGPAGSAPAVLPYAVDVPGPGEWPPELRVWAFEAGGAVYVCAYSEEPARIALESARVGSTDVAAGAGAVYDDGQLAVFRAEAPGGGPLSFRVTAEHAGGPASSATEAALAAPLHVGRGA